MRKAFIFAPLAALLLASCQWTRQDFAAPAMLQGEENYCVQVITPHYACNYYGNADSAVCDLPLLGDVCRVEYEGDSAAQGLALLRVETHAMSGLRRMGKSQLAYYPVGSWLRPRKVVYRLRHVRQTDSTLSFTVTYGKRKVARVRVVANFANMPSLPEAGEGSWVSDGIEFVSQLPYIYQRTLQLALLHAHPMGCGCKGIDHSGRLRHDLSASPDTLPYIGHFNRWLAKCHVQSHFVGDRQYLWTRVLASGATPSYGFQEYRVEGDTALVVAPDRDTAHVAHPTADTISLGFLTPRQRHLLGALVAAQNHAPDSTSSRNDSEYAEDEHSAREE